MFKTFKSLFRPKGRKAIGSACKPRQLRYEHLENRQLLAVLSGSGAQSAPDALVGDFNGDGRSDVATYTSDDGSWRVALSRGSSFDTSTWASGISPGTGWEWAVGDFNGDGRDDIAGYHSSDGSWWVNASMGSAFSPNQWAGGFSPRTGWEWAVGDFNGDGRDDIAGYHASDGSWWVNVSTGSSFGTAQWASGFSPRTGWEWGVGDFNGDGRDDIAGYHASDGSWWMNVSSGSNFATSQWASGFSPRTGWEWVIGDFTGDGRDDVAGYHASDGSWWVVASTGSSFRTTQWASGFSPRTGWEWTVGDFNGDGRDDIAGYHSSDGSWWVAEATPSGFATSQWSNIAGNGTGWKSLVGDFNADSRADLAGASAIDGLLWVATSTRTNNRDQFVTAPAKETAYGVTVYVSGSTLFIEGDSADNNLGIAYLDDSYGVWGDNIINGLGVDPRDENGVYQIAAAFTRIHAHMGDGNDSLELRGDKANPFESLYIDMGKARRPLDDYSFEQVIFGQIVVTGNVTVKAKDHLTIATLGNGPVLDGTTSIEGGSRQDSITLEGRFVALIIKTGSGNDSVTLGNNPRGIYDTFYAGRLTVETGSGNDTLTLQGGTVDRMMAHLGSDEDKLSMFYWAITRQASIDAGSERDTTHPFEGVARRRLKLISFEGRA